jgi:hypothetical protein
MRRVVVLGAVAMAVGACGGGRSTPAATVAPRTEGKLPTVARDGRCPVSRSHVVTRRFGSVLGHGPVYPAGLGPRSVLRIAPAERFNSRDWGGNKVLWVRRPGVRGTVVVRGRRLDARGEVRFESGDVPPDHLDLRARSEDGWVGYPSYTRVRAPGCYAYTIDGPGVHEVVVFRAVRER